MAARVVAVAAGLDVAVGVAVGVAAAQISSKVTAGGGWPPFVFPLPQTQPSTLPAGTRLLDAPSIEKPHTPPRNCQ